MSAPTTVASSSHFVPGDLIRYDGNVQPWDVVGEDLAVAVVDHAPLGGDLDVGVSASPSRRGCSPGP